VKVSVGDYVFWFQLADQVCCSSLSILLPLLLVLSCVWLDLCFVLRVDLVLGWFVAVVVATLLSV
jgi:hypothetical protein